MNPLLKASALLLIAALLLWLGYGKLKDPGTEATTTEQPDNGIAAGLQTADTIVDTEDDEVETEAVVGAYQRSSLVDPGETASVEIACRIPVLYPGPEEKNPVSPDNWTYQLLGNARRGFAKAGISINEITIAANDAEPETVSVWVVPSNSSVAGINSPGISWQDYGDPAYRALNLDGKGIVATGKMDEFDAMDRYAEIKENEKNTQVAVVTAARDWALQTQEIVAAYQLAFSIDLDTPADYYKRFPKDRTYTDNHINDTIEITTANANVLARFGISLALDSYGKGSGAKQGKLSITARCGRF